MSRSNSPIEFVGLVLTGAARIQRPDLEGLSPAGSGADAGSAKHRSVHFGTRGRVETPVLRRAGLPVGHKGHGPAIIEEYGSTTVVGPDDRFEIGRLGEIRIHCA